MKRFTLPIAAALMLAAGSTVVSADEFDRANQFCLENQRAVCTALKDPETIESAVKRMNVSIEIVIDLNGWQSLDPATAVIPSMKFFQFMRGT